MTRKPSNGFHLEETFAADQEEISVAERGRRHLQGPPKNFGTWTCQNEKCGHEWTGHDKIRQCPKCHTPNIILTPRPTITSGEPGLVETQAPAKPQSPAEKAAAGVKVEMIACSLIDPSPFQTREHFDQASLEQLAATIVKLGVLQAVIVRRVSGRFELIAGERRWRASKLARLKEIPARVVDLTDEEACEIHAIENIDREDLNPIERARTFQQTIEKCGYTQEVLAKRWKMSQEAISNSIRLLKLPEGLQERIITRQMSPTHAREVLPWADVPKVMEILGKVKPEDVGSAKDWRRTVLEAVKDASRPMTYITYSYGGGCMFKPTPAQKDQLDIREVPSWYGGQKERRAFNTKLWNELNGAAKKRKKEKETKKAAVDNGAHREQRAAMQADQATRDFLMHLYAIRIGWLQRLIAERFDELPNELRWKSILLIGFFGSHDGEIGKALGMKRNCPDIEELEAFLIPLNEHHLVERFQNVVCAELQREVKYQWGGVDQAFNETWLLHLAKVLGIKFADEWRPDEAFLALYDADDRDELVSTWELDGTDGKRSDRALIDGWPPGFVPDELLYATERGELKRPKGAPRPKKKPAKAGAT